MVSEINSGVGSTSLIVSNIVDGKEILGENYRKYKILLLQTWKILIYSKYNKAGVLNYYEMDQIVPYYKRGNI